MNVEEIIKKADTNEGLTVEEIQIYQQAVKPKKHVYGKYGTLAKQYIEEHNFGKLLSLAGHLPEYLHGVDKAAEELYDVLWDKLSKSETYQRTGELLGRREKSQRHEASDRRRDFKRNRLCLRRKYNGKTINAQTKGKTKV